MRATTCARVTASRNSHHPTMSSDSDFRPAAYFSSPTEASAYGALQGLMASSPIPAEETLANLGLFLTPAYLARILFMHQLYQRILRVHGVVMELGVRWGPNLALFSALRAMYEPHNHSR